MIRFSGVVKRHMGRGRRLGFPTANLDIEAEIEDGVYIALTEFENQRFPSLAFSGTAKTFNDTKKLFEVYILDFKQDLYGKEISVELFNQIRGVTKFKNADELVAQMKKDELVAREYFKQYNKNN